MINSCQTERAIRRHDALEDSLMELLRHKQYQDITVKDICVQAKIPRRTFYHYFESKDALMDSVVENLMTACSLAAMFDFTSGLENMKQSFYRFFRFWGGPNREQLEILLENNLETRLTAFGMLWSRQEQVGLFQINPMTEGMVKMSAAMVTSGFFTLLFYWVRNGCQQTPEEMAEYVAWFLTNPMFEPE